MTADKPFVTAKLDDLAHNPRVDPYAEQLARVARAVRSRGGDLLSGEGLTGVPLHPALVHFPIGGAYAAALLDLLGMGRAAGVVTAFTAAAAAPAVATGLASYAEAATPARRVGLAHAGLAGTGADLTALSLLARVAGRRGLARVTLWAACAAFAGAGLLGGHLVYGLDAEEPDQAESESEADAPSWGE